MDRPPDAHVDVVEALVSTGADLELASNSGATALTTALSADHDEVVRALLSAGADWSRAGVQEALRQRGLLDLDVSKLPGLYLFQMQKHGSIQMLSTQDVATRLKEAMTTSNSPR